MAYKVFGIRDSEKEGWFKHNQDCPVCATARTEVETPLGLIIAEVSGDENYPGIWLSFKANSDDYERTIALFEVEARGSVALKVWKDERKGENWTYYFPVEQKNGDV